MNEINEQEKKLHDMAIHVISLYKDDTFKRIFMEIRHTDSIREFYKHCVFYITQELFEHKLSHDVDIAVQKIRREQTILTKTLSMSKTEEENYYKSLGGGNAELGKELYRTTIMGRSDDKDDD